MKSRGLFMSIICHALCYLIKFDMNCMLLLCTVLSFNFIKDSKTLGYSFDFFDGLENRKNIITMLIAKFYLWLGVGLSWKGHHHTLRNSLALTLHSTHINITRSMKVCFSLVMDFHMLLLLSLLHIASGKHIHDSFYL